jgi:hypothetical protein
LSDGRRSFWRASPRVWLGRLLPYLVAGLVIALILKRYSFQAIYAEMVKGNSLPLVPIAIATYAISILFVGAADSMVLRGLLSPQQMPAYFSLVRGKAASVVFHIVHYALGQGAYATWLARKTGVTVGKITGILLYIVAAELCSVCLYALAVLALGRPAVPAAVPTVAATLSLTLVSAIVVLPYLRRPFARLVVLHPWTQGSPIRGLLQLGVRMFQHTTTTLGTWFAARAFGLDIPLWVMLSYVPVILIVSSLPVNVAGFGAVQGVWLLLSPWAEAERILAFSVMWQLASCLALLVRGMPFMRRTLAEIREGSPGVVTSAEGNPDFRAAYSSRAPDTRA